MMFWATMVIEQDFSIVYIGMVWYGMLFSSLPWGFSVADNIKYYAYF